MVKKKSKKKGSPLKKALLACKGKKGKKWKQCLRKKGIKVKK